MWCCAGYSEYVVRHFHNFEVDHVKILDKIIDSACLYLSHHGTRKLEIVLEHISIFDIAHADIVRKFLDVEKRRIEEGEKLGAVGRIVMDYLSDLKIDRIELAHIFFDAGLTFLVLEHHFDFEGIDHNDLAYRVIDDANSINKHSLDLKERIKNDEEKESIRVRYFEYGYRVGFVADYLLTALVAHIPKLEGLDHTKIAHRLIDTKQEYFLIYYFSNFKGLDRADIKRRLISTGRMHESSDVLHCLQ